MAQGDPEPSMWNGYRLKEKSDPLSTYKRLDLRAKLTIGGLLVASLILFVVTFWLMARHVSPPPAEYPHLLLGNPSDASADPANHENYLMSKPYFAIGYDDSKGVPLWVSWRLVAGDLGTAALPNEFAQDRTLPAGFKPVDTNDYYPKEFGFVHGQFCPHVDRSANTDMCRATFVMTNVFPQAPAVRNKPWAQLDAYCRQLVLQEHDRLYVIAGPAFASAGTSQGHGNHGKTLGLGRVLIPARCWKVVVVVPAGDGEDRGRITAETRVITVMMPNDHGPVKADWTAYRTSPAAVEQATGLHFFDRLRPEIANALKQKVDGQPGAPPALTPEN